jgi:tetratricopeptide (TPR) repeat protein
MPTYLWSVKDAQGAEIAEKITAPTAQIARELLEKRGYTDLKLIHDDIVAEFSRDNQALADTPAEKRLKWMRSGGKTTFVGYLLKVARDVALLALACGGGMFWRWSRADSLGVFFFGLILVVTTVLFARIRFKSYLFTRMLDAREWHRADETLRLLHSLATVLKPSDLSLYRSLALVWKGDLPTALADWQQHEPKISQWLFLSHLSSLYEAVGDIDRSIQLAEQSVAANPNIGALYVDLTWKYLLHERDLRLAKEANEKAQTLELSELAQPFLIRNRGIIALREGRFADAEKLLSQSLATWTANRKMYFRYSNMMITKGFLSQVRAKLGNINRARSDFAEAEEWLEAAQVTPLLTACRRALGL